jgi:hypothetical protein
MMLQEGSFSSLYSVYGFWLLTSGDGKPLSTRGFELTGEKVKRYKKMDRDIEETQKRAGSD